MTILNIILYAISYLLIGYYIARLPVEVSARWKEVSTGDMITNSTPLRVFLFPIGSMELVGRFETFGDKTWSERVASKEKSWGGYALFNMFFWPLRVVWFAVIHVVVLGAGALGCAILGVLLCFIADLLLIFKHLFTNSVSESEDDKIVQAKNS